jgi:hypothetical protein
MTLIYGIYDLRYEESLFRFALCVFLLPYCTWLLAWRIPAGFFPEVLVAPRGCPAEVREFQAELGVPGSELD